jgi:hypothetical protein
MAQSVVSLQLLTFLPHSHWLWLDSTDEEVLFLLQYDSLILKEN